MAQTRETPTAKARAKTKAKPTQTTQPRETDASKNTEGNSPETLADAHAWLDDTLRELLQDPAIRTEVDRRIQAAIDAELAKKGRAHAHEADQRRIAAAHAKCRAKRDELEREMAHIARQRSTAKKEMLPEPRLPRRPRTAEPWKPNPNHRWFQPKFWRERLRIARANARFARKQRQQEAEYEQALAEYNQENRRVREANRPHLEKRVKLYHQYTALEHRRESLGREEPGPDPNIPYQDPRAMARHASEAGIDVGDHPQHHARPSLHFHACQRTPDIAETVLREALAQRAQADNARRARAEPSVEIEWGEATRNGNVQTWTAAPIRVRRRLGTDGRTTLIELRLTLTQPDPGTATGNGPDTPWRLRATLATASDHGPTTRTLGATEVTDTGQPNTDGNGRDRGQDREPGEPLAGMTQQISQWLQDTLRETIETHAQHEPKRDPLRRRIAGISRELRTAEQARATAAARRSIADNLRL